MLTIRKGFTILSLLCLCGNGEYLLSFQNKPASSSFKWVPKYILFLAKLKGKGRPFLEWTSIYLSSKLSLTCGDILTISKIFVTLFLLCPANREHLRNFQNKSVSSLFDWVSRYILFLAKLKKRGRPFFESARKDWHCEINPRALGCHKK